MRDLGLLTEFLGLEIHHAAESISITQKKYTLKIIERAGLSEANSNLLPIPANTSFGRYEGEKIDYPYGARIGELLYLALGSRPDIAFAVQHLSQFTKNPGPQHIAAVRQVYRYLRGSEDYGISYSRTNAQHEPVGYADADWAQSILDRRSISGQVFIIAGGAVSWASKKQSTVVLSTLEAEYLALSLAVRHAIWIIQLYQDLSLTIYLPLMLKVDNLGALTISNDPQHHGRTKHIDVHHHFLRLQQEEGRIRVLHTPGETNPADLLTKALARTILLRHCQEMGVGADDRERGLVCRVMVPKQEITFLARLGLEEERARV